MTTTTQTIAYRAIRDHYVKAYNDLVIAIRDNDAGDMSVDWSEADAALWKAWDDLYMHRCAMEDDGISWQQIDHHDGYTEPDPER